MGQSFNPRAREGRDLYSTGQCVWSIYVSIHAPVKGATSSMRYGLTSVSCFNPRAREGRDLNEIRVEIV